MKLSTASHDTRSWLIVALRVILAIVTSLGLVVAARISGPGEFGRISILLIVIALIQDFIDFGASTWLTRKLRTRECNIGCFSRTYRRKLLMTLAWILMLSLVASEFFTFSETIYICSASFILITLNLHNIFFQQFSVVNANFRWSLFSLICDKSSMLSFILWFYIWGSPLVAFLNSLILGAVIHYILGYRYLAPFRKSEKQVQNGHLCHVNGKRSRKLGIMSITTDLLQLDVAIVSFFSGYAQSGVYAAVFRLRNTLNLGYYAAAMTVPNIASEDPSGRSFHTWFAKNRIILGLNTLALIAIALNAEWIVRLTLGSEFEGAGSVLVLLCLGMFFSIFSIPIGSFLTYSNNEKALYPFIILGVGLNLLLASIGAYVGGSVGAAFGYFVTQFLFSFALLGIMKNLRTKRETSIGGGSQLT